MDTSDPDLVAKVYVMQWMHENGLHNALKALEKDLGRLYDDSQLPEASQLMQLVWRHVEERAQLQDELGANLEDEEEGGGAGTLSHQQPQRQTRRQRRQHQEEALWLLRSGSNDFATRRVVAEVPPEVHRANVIAVRMVPEQDCVITATGDGYVRCVRYGGGGGNGGNGGGGASEVVWQTRLGSSALLSLALHPSYSRGVPLVAVGGMDGCVAVLHGPSGAALASLQLHAKYVVRVAWDPDEAAAAVRSPRPEVGPSAAAAAVPMEGATRAASGANASASTGPAMPGRALILASASTDETVAILRLDHNLDLDAVAGAGAGIGGPASERNGGGGDGGPGGCTAQQATGTWRLTLVRQIPYGAAITDVAFLRRGPLETSAAGTAVATGAGGGVLPSSFRASSSPCSSGSTLVVAVRGSNYLRLLDVGRVVRQSSQTHGLVAAPGVGGGPVPETLVNLNERGDDHVSFTAKYLATSPCGSYLLVCTDTSRLLLLRTADWSQLRPLFGLPVDQFPQPAAAWHRDSSYVYVTGAGAQLCVFHVGSGRLVHSRSQHKVNVRDLDYDPARNRLATCSFDKTVKLLGQEEEEEVRQEVEKQAAAGLEAATSEPLVRVTRTPPPPVAS